MRCLLPTTILLLLAAFLAGAVPAFAAIEIGRDGRSPALIQDVYQRDGAAFVAIDEVLAILGLTGQWDNVAHVYRIDTLHGQVVISPGSDYLKRGESAVEIAQRPRFIDGKLRVSETFLIEQFAPFLGIPLSLKNLNPVAPPPPESPLDELFSLLLRQRPKAAAASDWVVAIDPGHGGQDAGALGRDGTTERAVNLGVALQLQKLMKMRRNAPVVMTRDADYAVSALQRLEAAARGQADVLLSLHAQSHFTPTARGVELFVAPAVIHDGAPAAVPGVNASRQLAESLRGALVAAGYRVAPVRERPLLPLGQGNLPRVLIEMGYLSSDADLADLRDAARQALLARALFSGLEAFLKNYQDLQESQDEPGQPAAQ